MTAGARGGTFLTHQANPVTRRDSLGRTVLKCADCTRRVHLRRGRGDVLIYVHTGRRSKQRDV